MADTKELKRIKKIYGERFKNLCRDMFPDILEQEGTLLPVLENIFSHNCNSLYQSIIQNSLTDDFKELIYSKLGRKIEKEEQTVETRTPYEILDEAGYNLYECKTEEDIQSYRKYYAPGEVLCTIYNGGRLATRDCFFAVKKGVDEIKRENFEIPNKQDEYSTSVLGIQFTRGKHCRVEIISRYNHKVDNPNCTLDNDLDKLVPGLKQSFTNLLKERGMDLEQSQSGKELFKIPGYTLARDGKYYKYNIEIFGTYCCPGNIVIMNGYPKTEIAPEKGIIFENFCLDLENKRIEQVSGEPDSFLADLKDIDRIDVEKTKEKGRTIRIHLKGRELPIIIGINENNQIVKYENQYLQQVGYNFLKYNEALEELNLPQLQQVGSSFLEHNQALKRLELPNLQQAGYYFLTENEVLEELNLPQLQQVKLGFLKHNRALKRLNLPNLQQVNFDFLERNEVLEEVSLPQLQEVGGDFLAGNQALKRLNLPNLQQVNSGFLKRNEVLEEVSLPQLQEVGGDFLADNRALKRLNLPNLQQAGDGFLYHNEALEEANFPQLQEVGYSFLANNQVLTRLNLPQMPEFEREIITKNQDKKNKVGPTDIAKLDRKSWLTKLEITSAKKVIEKLKEKFLGKKNKNKDEDKGVNR